MQNKNVKLLHFGNERTENGGVYTVILPLFFLNERKFMCLIMFLIIII